MTGDCPVLAILDFGQTWFGTQNKARQDLARVMLCDVLGRERWFE